MKKVLLLIFVALIASASFAQARFSTTFRCGYDFPNGSVNNKSAGGDLIFGSQIGDRWNVGVGSGFYYCNLLLEEYNKTKTRRAPSWLVVMW